VSKKFQIPGPDRSADRTRAGSNLESSREWGSLTFV